MIPIEIMPEEDRKKCPICRRHDLKEVKFGVRHGLVEINEKGKPVEGKSLIPLKVMRCPKCGAIMMFDTTVEK